MRHVFIAALLTVSCGTTNNGDTFVTIIGQGGAADTGDKPTSSATGGTRQDTGLGGSAGSSNGITGGFTSIGGTPNMTSGTGGASGGAGGDVGTGGTVSVPCDGQCDEYLCVEGTCVECRVDTDCEYPGEPFCNSDGSCGECRGATGCDPDDYNYGVCRPDPRGDFCGQCVPGAKRECMADPTCFGEQTCSVNGGWGGCVNANGMDCGTGHGKSGCMGFGWNPPGARCPDGSCVGPGSMCD